MSTGAALTNNAAAEVAARRREGAVVPREIVAWLQTLQLSFPVKHPKRDLSNGFMVGEICSRYWPSVPMHSLENKTSSANKLSNWSVLRTLFAKQQVPLSDKMIDGMVSCREQYAESLLKQLYTLLTGKEVREAEPLQLPEVAAPHFTPGGFAQHMKNTMEAYQYLQRSDSDEDAEERNARAEASRAAVNPRQGQGRLMQDSVTDTAAAKLAALNSAAGTPALRSEGTAQMNAVHKMQRNAGDSHDGGAESAEDAKNKFVFDVSVRATEKSSTVLQQGGASTSGDESGARKDGGSTKLKDHMLKSAHDKPPATATEWMNRIVKYFGEKDGWRLTPQHPLHALFFLNREKDIDASVVSTIWAAILSSVGSLAVLVRRDTTVLAELVRLVLLVKPAQAQKSGTALPSTTSTTVMAGASDGSATAGAALSLASAPCYTPSPRAFVLCAALLSHLTDTDPHFALSTFVGTCGVLGCPEIRAVLRSLTYTTAEQYATLVCSVVSADRQTASTLLPDLLSSVYEAITEEDDSATARRSFLTLLRAIVARLVKTQSGCGAGTSIHKASVFNKTGTSAVSSHTPANSLASGLFHTNPGGSPARTPVAEDSLNVAVFSISSYNAIGSLNSEVAAVRLAGTALAVTLTQVGLPLKVVLDTFMPLLFPQCTVVSSSYDISGTQGLEVRVDTAGTIQMLVQSSPALNVLRAMWLRVLHQRTLAERQQEVAEEQQRQQPASSRANGTTLLLGGILATLTATMAAYVASPGGHLKAKALVSYQLVCCLDAVQPYSTPQEALTLINDSGKDTGVASQVAYAVMHFYCRRASPDITRVITSGPLEGRSHSASGAASGGAAAQSAASCLWHHETLGPLSAPDMLKAASSLLLSAAVLRVFAIPADAPLGKEAARRLPVRASLLARERRVSEWTQQRIMWLYRVNVVGRGGVGEYSVPVSPAGSLFSSVTTGVTAWGSTVFTLCYDDLALVTAAAEVLSRQNTARLDEPISIALMDLAAMAQRVILKWFGDLALVMPSGGPAAAGAPQSSGGSNTPRRDRRIVEENRETLAESMAWFHSLYGGRSN